MANLITAAEVITYAFDRSVDTTKIKDTDIKAAEVKHILPMLGEDFYDAVVADQTTYATLIGYIKPVLAYWVAFYIMPRLWVETGTVGMARIQGQNRAVATNGEYEKARAAKQELAQLNTKTLTKYLSDNQSSYPLYFKGANPAERVRHVGGIVMRNDGLYTDECDDYTMGLTGY
jgi:uncharacterized membrane protein